MKQGNVLVVLGIISLAVTVYFVGRYFGYFGSVGGSAVSTS